MEAGLEKRQGKRKSADNISVSLRPLDPQVWFRFWNGSESSVRDISMVGIGLFCEHNIPVGTPLSIDIRLGKKSDSIRIFGKVQWISAFENCYRAGVSFSWWKEEQDKKEVNNFLENITNVN